MESKPTPGFVVWLTGLPSSGKSTLARLLQQKLAEHGTGTQLLDSDELRQRLTPQPTYAAEERDWFYNIIIFLAELLAHNGVNVLIAATAPRRQYRQTAREKLTRFAEVFVDCPIELCQTRDPKGLWQQANEGKISTLPGAGVAYEPPSAPEIRVDTDQQSPEEATLHILQRLIELRFLPNFLQLP